MLNVKLLIPKVIVHAKGARLTIKVLKNHADRVTTAVMMVMGVTRVRSVCWARHRDRADRAVTAIALVIAVTM